MAGRRARCLFLWLSLFAAPALAQDQIDLSSVKVYDSPNDIGHWPITTTITQLVIQPSPPGSAHGTGGLSFAFSARSTWPDYIPPGWEGPIQYTVWAVVNINGSWHTSGIVQMWRDRPSTGAAPLTEFARSWVYDSRWGPMVGHQPVIGEQMGFFVSAGNARGVGGVTSVRERSNVVVVALPANDTGAFEFVAPVPLPPPPVPVPVPPAPTPQPVPTPVPQPLPPDGSIQSSLDRIESAVAGVRTSLEEHRSALKEKFVWFTKYIGLPAVAALAGLMKGKP